MRRVNSVVISNDEGYSIAQQLENEILEMAAEFEAKALTLRIEPIACRLDAAHSVDKNHIYYLIHKLIDEGWLLAEMGWALDVPRNLKPSRKAYERIGKNLPLWRIEQ